MEILIPWSVFAVFAIMAVFAEAIWVNFFKLMRFPRTVSVREALRTQEEDIPRVRILSGVAAVGSGLIAIAGTIQLIFF